MNSRKEGKTQVTCAAKAGISERSARAIDTGERNKPSLAVRSWRTRRDPLEAVWSSELLPMLETSPELSAMTLLEYLQSKYSDKYPDSQLRTLQRRVKQWRALEGPPKEVMFSQTHAPGELGLSDFTELKECEIVINGEVLSHRLYHFRLAYSHWSSVRVVLGGESFTALAEGLQDALWRLGASPLEHRTDSLSAAFKNLSREAQDDLTQRYKILCEHYGMKPTRNNRGVKHENGSIESAHGHIKRRIQQALLLRQSNEFESIEAYQTWLNEVVEQHNRRNAKKVEVEKAALRALPKSKAVDCTELVARVTSTSTIQVRTSLYSVPSRLIGHTLRVRLYDNRLDCYLGNTHVVTLNRVYGQGSKRRARNIDYRHVIHSLKRKPQAFRKSQIREDIIPNEDYRCIWDYVDTHMPSKEACRFMVGILYLAATQDCEESLSRRVIETINKGGSLRLSALENRFKANKVTVPDVSVEQHRLDCYDELLNKQQQEVCYVRV